MKRLPVTILLITATLCPGVQAHAQHRLHHQEMQQQPPMLREEAMAEDSSGLGQPREIQHHMGSHHFWWLELERLEHRSPRNEEDSWAMEGRVSWGSTLNRLVLELDGQRSSDPGTVEGAVQLHGDHAFNRWWRAVGGLRHEHSASVQDRTWLLLGLEGLAPYWLETRWHLHVHPDQVRTRLQVSQEWLLTQRLQLEPSARITALLRDRPDQGEGRGLAHSQLRLQLGYQVHRQWTPYLALSWHQWHGNTARMREGHRSDRIWMLGISGWY